MTVRFHQLSTWFVLVVALFAAVPPAQGMVICFGDGHVDLGDFEEECPCDHGVEEPGAEESDVDEHGPCHDVVIDPLETAFDSASSRIVVDVVLAPAPPLFAALITPTCLVDALPTAALMPPDAGLPRSVVLLI